MDFLAKEYLLFEDKGKKITFDDYYIKYKKKFLKSKKNPRKSFLGLPKHSIIYYKGEKYNKGSYNEYFKKFNMLHFLSPQINFNNDYINIVYSDLVNHFNMARFSLVESAQFILNRFDYDWDTRCKEKNLYIGMYMIRNFSIVTSTVSYNHTLDKLYCIFCLMLYIILEKSSVTDNIEEDIKNIFKKSNKNYACTKWGEMKDYLNTTEKDLMKNFIAELNKISEYTLNPDNYISNISNGFKHRGNIIEIGLKSLSLKWLKETKGYSLISNNVYDEIEDLIEYDVDVVASKLFIFHNMIIDFLSNQMKTGILKSFILTPLVPSEYTLITQEEFDRLTN